MASHTPEDKLIERIAIRFELDLVERIRASAKRTRRSFNAEVLQLIDEALIARRRVANTWQSIDAAAKPIVARVKARQR